MHACMHALTLDDTDARGAAAFAASAAKVKGMATAEGDGNGARVERRRMMSASKVSPPLSSCVFACAVHLESTPCRLLLIYCSSV